MNEATYGTLSATARQALLMERMSTGLANQCHALEKDGLPEIALADVRQARALVLRVANRLKRECSRLCRGERLYEFTENTHGLSHSVYVFLGCVPPMTAFANPAKLWAWCGLAPGQRRQAGQKARFSPQMKAHAHMRIAEPCIKAAASPYRAVYLKRKVRTAETHPEWPQWRRHSDARRIAAKAILLDLWLVDNGKEPVVGGQVAPDTPRAAAPDPGSHMEAAD